METSFEPYEGARPYIFVSYAHADSEQVRPVLEALNRAGYRVWYDKGIKTGSLWRDYIAEHIENCHTFIPLLSHTFDKRPECSDEVSHAKGKGRAIIPVYLEDVTLTYGLEMALMPIQGCKLSDYQGNADKLVESLPRITNHDVEATRRTKWSAIRRIEQYLDNIDWEYYLNQIGQFINDIKSVDWQLVLIIIIGGGTLTLIAMFFAQNAYTIALFVFLILLPFWRSRPKGKRFARIDPKKVSSIFSISNGYTMIEEYACANHTKLKAVFISNSVTEMGTGAFQKCDALAYVLISKNIKKISRQTFFACTHLINVKIPDGVQEIGVSAFSSCENLRNVSIPDSVMKIGNDAFHDCPNLRRVSVPAHTEISPTAFDSTTEVIRR